MPAIRAASADEIGRIELRNVGPRAPAAVEATAAAQKRTAMNFTISRGGRIRTDGLPPPKRAL